MARLCRDGGRERIKIDINFGFSLPQSRFARQLPRQREPIYTPTFAKEPIFYNNVYFTISIFSITGCSAAEIVPLLSVGFASAAILSTTSIPLVTYPKAAY